MNIKIDEVVKNVFTVSNLDDTKVATIVFHSGVFDGCKYNISNTSSYTLKDWEFLVKVGNFIMQKQEEYIKEDGKKAQEVVDKVFGTNIDCVVHFKHCYQGEYKTSCKYGDEDCPARAGIELNGNYWDCECEENYIHSNEDLWCYKCKVRKSEQPNSRVNEVREMFKKQDKEYKY